MEKHWYEIILENWAQITVLIGIVGITLQQLIQYLLKKREITFGRLQENKILEIKAFYKSYQKLNIVLWDYLVQTEFGKHDKEIFNEMKSKIRKHFIDFDYHVMTVKLFIDSGDIKVIDEIRQTLESIRKDISIWLVNNEFNNHQDGVDKLKEIMDVRFPKTLPSLIARIEGSLRKSMKLD